MDENPYSAPAHSSKAPVHLPRSGRIYLFSSLLPSFVRAVRSERELDRLFLDGERDPREWARGMFAVNEYGQRGRIHFEKGFSIEWTDEIIAPEELRTVMTKRLQLLGWKDCDFASSVTAIEDVGDFDALYARFPDRAEWAGLVKGCIYVAFITLVVVVFVCWRLRRLFL